jgi:hypothetical protein
MKQQETAQFLAVVKTAYPHFDISEEVVRLWHQFLSAISFVTAQKNLNDHIASNRFPPTIADIVRKDPNQYVDYAQLREETEERLIQLEQGDPLAIDCPPHLLPKSLKSGVGD